MTIGLNYGAHNGNEYTSYLAAVTDAARSLHMGCSFHRRIYRLVGDTRPRPGQTAPAFW